MNQRPDQVDEYIWLGSLGARQNKPLLRIIGIEVVIAVMDVDNRSSFEADEEFLDYDIELDDTPQANLLDALRKLLIILEKERGKKILIHCVAGQSRSAALVIGYLMKKINATFSECFHRVKGIRPCIMPNKGFIDQLLSLEKHFL